MYIFEMVDRGKGAQGSSGLKKVGNLIAMMGFEQKKSPKVGNNNIVQKKSKYTSHCTPFERIFWSIRRLSKKSMNKGYSI